MNTHKYIETYLNSCQGKTIVVTGANSGIGFLICKTLVKLGGKVIMAGRSKQRLEAAKNDILKEFSDGEIELIDFDLDDLTKVSHFKDELIIRYPNFDGLILNAGILSADKEDVTKQGFPKVVGDNFLAIYYLMRQLKPYLDKRTTPCKIIFQGSLMSRRISYKDNELTLPNSKGLRSYSVSKAGVENLFYACASKNENEKVAYLLAEPGACKTNIYHNLPKWLIPPADLFMSVAFHTALKGSLTALSLMCNNNCNGSILVPRGIGHFSGYPIKIKIPKKVLKNKHVLEDGYRLIKDI